GRMDVHGALQGRVGSIRVHGIEDRMDRLVAARAEDRGAEDAPGVGVDQHLHEAESLALLDRAAYPRHRPTPDQQALAGRPRLPAALASRSVMPARPSGGSMNSA